MTKDTNNFIQNFILQDKTVNKNIGTFTAVYRHPVVTKYLPNYMHKNLIDKNAYSSLKYLHEIMDDFFKKIYTHKNGKTIVTSGSTEAILLALYFQREHAKKEKNIKKPNIVVPQHAHISIIKSAKMLGIEVIKANLNKDFSVDPSDIEKKINKNTILIVGVMGTTELGVIDDLKTLDIIAQKKGVPLHIDAAIGGFIIPFLDNTNIPYSFSHLKSLASINISGHKYGLSLPGCGILLVRNSKIALNSSEQFSYLSSGKSTVHTLLITSSSLGAFSLGLNILEIGIKGYEQNAKRYIKTKAKFKETLTSIGIDHIGGSEFIPQIYICPKNIKKISDRLSNKGWMQSPYKGVGQKKTGIRVVIKKGQESAITTDFVKDLVETMKAEQPQKGNAIMPINYL